MILLRSLVFALFFYGNTTMWVVVGIPTLLLPYPLFMRLTVKPWARTGLWLHRVICGVTVEVRGREHLPPGPILIAAKHQSVFETLFFVSELPVPTYIAKRELFWLPLFGWYLWKSRQISIDRGKRAAVVAQLNRQAQAAIARGGQLVIFPEGTRRPVGARPAYKSGVYHLHSEIGVACVPVALNAGVVWPRRTFLKYPGRLIVEYLPPIAPGLAREAFMTRLQQDIEPVTNRLVAEARAGSRA
jgi:1-acyl-sn-glycerol-3-phosphate acyltransferase